MFRPGDIVMIVGKLDNKIRTLDENNRTGTYMGDLRMENVECYVMLEDGYIWTGLKRELVKV